jgi:putative transposase
MRKLGVQALACLNSFLPFQGKLKLELLTWMYRWRRISAEERRELLDWRIKQEFPWHSPPHRSGPGQYLLTAASYEHRPHIGASLKRMQNFCSELLQSLQSHCSAVHAWVLLPNHHHSLVTTPNLDTTLKSLGLLHGRTSHRWNGEKKERGRKVWFNVVDRTMRSERHYWSTINYIHHNPVRHGYVAKWQDWPFSSASEYLAEVGMERALEIWRSHPLLDYGKGWDEPDV